ncbi:ZCF37 [Abeliophyllum distichum]|uniref:ZCF37 n=1 Tax=Abeliophyllum distichum TaxID=126358 RepID=A0ABD1SZ46_9LAMI
MFICGSGSFKQVEDDPEIWSPCSTPKRSKKGTSFFRNKDSRNPYADRGLDKFYALLADLDEKRQKIYTQNGSEDISFVRFVYSNSNDVKPIVVKVKEKKQEKPNVPDVKIQQNSSEAQSDKPTVETLKAPNAAANTDDQVLEPRRKHKCLACRNFKWQKLRQPYYYIPMIIILILILLSFYGRSFAILCTSIGWYLIPTIKGESSSSRKPKRKKELSEKKIVNNEGSSSPTSVINGPTDHKSPRQHGHRRSW